MIEITKVNSRTWSMLGSRRTFGAVMDELASGLSELFVLCGDVKASSGLDRFAKNHPDKFLNCGIAEQNMICVASGLASEGKTVFAVSFSPFITGRCYDQIRIHLGMMQHNVKLVGIGAGIGLDLQGNTHYGLDDASLMCTIPNMTVIAPSDCAEVAKAIEAAYYHNGPVYLRLCGKSNNPIINKEDYDFNIGRAIKLREGKDVSIFASGTMVSHSLKAAKSLADDGIDVSVTNMHTLKPIDTQAIDEAMQSRLIVSVEEGFVHGGLSSIISRHLANRPVHPPLLSIGIDDIFPVTGGYKYMLNQLGLTAEQIADSIKNRIEQS